MKLELSPEQRAWLLSTVRQEELDDKTFHVTELLSPSWQTVLERVHADVVTAAIEANPARLAAMALGTALHEAKAAFLKKQYPTALVEHPMEMKYAISGDDEYTVVGTLDLWVPRSLNGDEGDLQDHKSAKNYKLVRGDFIEWERQVNIYALMLYRTESRRTLSAGINAYLMDFSAPKAEWKPKEPQQQAGFILMKMRPMEEVRVYVDLSLRALRKDMQTARAGGYGECGEEDRWRGDMRCKHYCFVREACPYWKKIKDSGAGKGKTTAK